MSTAEIKHLTLRSRPPRRTLWAWLRALAHVFERAPAAQRPGSAVAFEAAAAEASQEAAVPRDNSVLPFPIRGEALLVRLATGLRARFAGRGSDDDPLLLTITRSPQLRLTIDRIAHIEFREQGRAFRLAVETNPDTTLSLETEDIDIIVGFVTRYIGEKLGEASKLEVAS